MGNNKECISGVIWGAITTTAPARLQAFKSMAVYHHWGNYYRGIGYYIDCYRPAGNSNLDIVIIRYQLHLAF